jgi:hypothetical protein
MVRKPALERPSLFKVEPDTDRHRRHPQLLVLTFRPNSWSGPRTFAIALFFAIFSL